MFTTVVRAVSVALALVGCHPVHQQEALPPPVIEIDARVGGEPTTERASRSEPARVIDGGTYEVAPNLKVPESWVECATEDDCAIVEAGCCDHCNGGVIVSVNAKFAAKLRPLVERFGCDAAGSACSTRNCDAPTDHEIVCMTRACHIVDLEPDVQDYLWGEHEPDDSSEVLGGG